MGIFPSGASPCSALDMAGNVLEWTSSLFADYPYDAADGREDAEAGESRTLRGGAWNYSDRLVRCAYRFYWDPDYRRDLVGFRLQSPGSNL